MVTTETTIKEDTRGRILTQTINQNNQANTNNNNNIIPLTSRKNSFGQFTTFQFALVHFSSIQFTLWFSQCGGN